MESINSYIKLQRKAILLGIAVLTSLDTANALADIFASRFNQFNTELVNLNNMRNRKTRIKFYKMQSCGNDYIFFDNTDGQITCPESLAINFADRHYGIGGDGIVLMENSKIADCKMRIFNLDGSEGEMAGNSIRCLAKYIYDKNIKKKEILRVETKSGIRELKLISFNGEVNSVSVEMGQPDLHPQKIPTTLTGENVINREVEIEGKKYNITLVSVGNPHCVIFCDKVDAVNVPEIGAIIEHCEYFPERINTEFIRVVNKNTLKMRVWERGNGETLACGTGAVAAVVAAVLNGYCNKGEDITVKLRGGDLIVNYSDAALILTGSVSLVFEGEVTF
jgi:carbamoyl-phosphate synthase large subunit